MSERQVKEVLMRQEVKGLMSQRRVKEVLMRHEATGGRRIDE